MMTDTQTPDTEIYENSFIRRLTATPYAQLWQSNLTQVISWPFCDPPVHKITDKLLAKKCRGDTELKNMLYVREHTTIPVPQPRYTHCTEYLVMDFVEGRMLYECWDSLSHFMQFRIACTMRGYVNQLRELHGTIPGSPSNGLMNGPLFDDYTFGPFNSSLHFRRFCTRIAQVGWLRNIDDRKAQGLPPRPPPLLHDEWPLCFVHGDLNLANIILSNNGVLWLVDWAHSGFFPPWLESVAMGFARKNPQSWRKYHWFMVGVYPRFNDFWCFFWRAANHH